MAPITRLSNFPDPPRELMFFHQKLLLSISFKTTFHAWGTHYPEIAMRGKNDCLIYSQMRSAYLNTDRIAFLVNLWNTLLTHFLKIALHIREIREIRRSYPSSANYRLLWKIYVIFKVITITEIFSLSMNKNHWPYEKHYLRPWLPKLAHQTLFQISKLLQLQYKLLILHTIFDVNINFLIHSESNIHRKAEDVQQPH